VGVGKTVGRLMERQGRQWCWVDPGGCLDPAATGPYGGSSATREEEKPRTGSTTGASAVEKDRHARVRVQPQPPQKEASKEERPSRHQIQRS
jgi:hypothetical protein